MIQNQEVGNIFPDNPYLQNVLAKSLDRINHDLNKLNDSPLSERPNLALGSVFEDLASQEILEKHPETEKQKEVRQIVEEMFQNADKITGNERISKPDFVSVIFDQQGRMIIDEVIEFKTSAAAFNKKKDRQPQNSLYTVDTMVDLINHMNKSENLQDLPAFLALNDLPEGQMLLTQIFQRIKSLNLKEEVKLSENLIYHVRTLNGVFIEPPHLNLSIGRGDKKRKVRIRFSNSAFNLKNCLNIIDHFAENNIE